MKDLIEDAQNLLARTDPSDGVDRRDFLKTAIGTGFAVAALPVVAQNVIHTDSAGLTAGVITVTVNGQKVPVYRAQPEGKTNLPVVLVVSEIFGLHEHIADVARRFAKLGYLALAPDLFIRHGDAAHAPMETLMRDIVGKTPDSEVLADLDAVVAWAKTNGGNPAKIAITGFCWGGRITWLYAAHNPEIKAGVAWYGRLVGEKTPINPRHPIDIAPDLTVPVLGLYGLKDKGIPLETIDQMRDALPKQKSGSKFILYPDSGHAFHADYRPSYEEADAKDAFNKLLEWFKQNGVV